MSQFERSGNSKRDTKSSKSILLSLARLKNALVEVQAVVEWATWPGAGLVLLGQHRLLENVARVAFVRTEKNINKYALTFDQTVAV